MEGFRFGLGSGGVSFVGLDEDPPSVAADDGEKRVLIRLLESGLKAELVAAKSDGLIDVLTMKNGEIACVVGRVLSVESPALVLLRLTGLNGAELISPGRQQRIRMMRSSAFYPRQDG